MKENSIEKDEEILNNIKAYMQENIDKGCHKFVYNDLGYDEKCVDVINAIEHILSDYKRVLKENETLSRENRKLKEENEYNKILLDMNNNFTIDKKTGNYKWNVIEIQKVKDKIEELNNISNAEKLEDIMIGGNYTITELFQYVLQELIEEREEKE